MIICNTCITSPSESTKNSVYDIGHFPQLFMDDLLIKDSANIWRKVQNPKKHPNNPVVKREYPWESLRTQAYGGVLYDNEQDVFKMWYMPYGPNWSPARLGYAESKDGVSWVKPLYDMYPYEGKKSTNILLQPEGGARGIAVIKDMHETNPERKYKAMYSTKVGSGYEQKIVYSRDGIRWYPDGGLTVMKGKKDSGLTILWSNKRSKYLAYMRQFDAAPSTPLPPLGVYRLRTHGYSESDDFLNWKEPMTVFRTDESDGAGGTVQVYDMPVVPYGDIFIGRPSLLHIQELVNEYHPGHPGDEKKFTGSPLEIGFLEVQLSTSRDGIHWSRVGNREAFIPRGQPGAWDDEEIRCMQNWAIKDDIIYIYYLGSSNPHATGSPGAIGLATLPVDRFVSVEPLFASKKGKLETISLKCDRGELLINAHIAGGVIEIEVLDAENKIIKGYDAKSTLLTKYDALRYSVSWSDQNGNRSLNDVLKRGAVFRLRFLLDGQVQLFAFQVQ